MYGIWNYPRRGFRDGREFFAADASGQHSAPGGPAFFAYSTNYLIDVEHGIDVEAAPANRSMEVRSAERMIYRVVAQDRAKRG